MTNTHVSPDGKIRCKWSEVTSQYRDYHDLEWGFPVDDDFRLYEKLCLESFQSGLSWRTILEKRENFRQAFAQFDFNKVAKFTEKDVTRLLDNAGIVRHRGKIEATINNARCAVEMVKKEGSLAAYFWRFEPTEPAYEQNRSTSGESIALAKDLKKRGWKFFGPTTAYAFMQAMGLVNDHANDCFVRQQVIEARKKFVKPN